MTPLGPTPPGLPWDSDHIVRSCRLTARSPTSCRYRSSIPAQATVLEIELTNACVVRLRGVIDSPLLEAAIAAAGQLEGPRQGAH